MFNLSALIRMINTNNDQYIQKDEIKNFVEKQKSPSVFNEYFASIGSDIKISEFDDFKSKYSEWNKHDDYSYEFVCDYLKNLDPYYGDIYSIFMQLSKEEYVDTCKNILENFPEQIKRV